MQSNKELVSKAFPGKKPSKIFDMGKFLIVAFPGGADNTYEVNKLTGESKRTNLLLYSKAQLMSAKEK